MNKIEAGGHANSLSPGGLYTKKKKFLTQKTTELKSKQTPQLYDNVNQCKFPEFKYLQMF